MEVTQHVEHDALHLLDVIEAALDVAEHHCGEEIDLRQLRDVQQRGEVLRVGGADVEQTQ